MFAHLEYYYNIRH